MENQPPGFPGSVPALLLRCRSGECQVQGSAMRQTPNSPKEDVEAGEMKKKVLITYASKYGSTGGVADAIGKELCSKDLAADVVLIKNAGNVGSYQGVVIGSAIYMGKWMSEAVDFVEKNQDFLRSSARCLFPCVYDPVPAGGKEPGRSILLHGPDP